MVKSSQYQRRWKGVPHALSLMAAKRFKEADPETQARVDELANQAVQSIHWLVEDKFKAGLTKKRAPNFGHVSGIELMLVLATQFREWFPLEDEEVDDADVGRDG